MVAKAMAATSRENLASLIHSAKLAIDIPSKLDSLRKLKTELPQEDPVILTEFLPPLFDFLSDRFSPVRKFVTEYFRLHLFCFDFWLHCCLDLILMQELAFFEG